MEHLFLERAKLFQRFKSIFSSSNINLLVEDQNYFKLGDRGDKYRDKYKFNKAQSSKQTKTYTKSVGTVSN